MRGEVPMPAEPLRDIMQIALTVTDLPRAVAFYRDRLQLPLLFEVPRLAFFQAGAVRLMLGLPEDGTAAQAGSPIYFRIGDLPTTVEALKARGVTFESEPHLIAKMPDHDLWLAFLRDPDGNPIGLMSEVRNA
jgi:methylmalonyl-CoA/ethylmalonyl-CoA epimerase